MHTSEKFLESLEMCNSPVKHTGQVYGSCKKQASEEHSGSRFQNGLVETPKDAKEIELLDSSYSQWTCVFSAVKIEKARSCLRMSLTNTVKWQCLRRWFFRHLVFKKTRFDEMWIVRRNVTIIFVVSFTPPYAITNKRPITDRFKFINCRKKRVDKGQCQCILDYQRHQTYVSSSLCFDWSAVETDWLWMDTLWEPLMKVWFVNVCPNIQRSIVPA